MKNHDHTVKDIPDLNRLIDTERALLIWFSHDECNVCKALFPKIKIMRDDSFPELAIVYCDSVKNPEIAAQYSIFAVPALLIYFEGKEYIREVRHISISQVESQLERLYQMVFDK